MANDDVTGGSGSGALREDMISNAVAFLKHPQVRILDAPGRRAPITSRAPCLEPTREISSHPSHRRRTASRSTRAQPAPSSQVTSSPEAQKRQFLEKKGLSAEEIDEAFKRAPQPAPAPAPAPASPVAPPAASVSPTRDDAEAKRLAQSQVTQQRKTSYRTTPAMADPYQYIRSGNYAKILAKEPGPAVASMMMPRQQHKVSDGLRAVGHAKTMTERQSAEPQTHALEGLNGYRTTPAMADPYKYIRSGNYAKILSKFGSANPITGWKPTIQNSKQVSLRALAQMLAAKPMRNAAAINSASAV